MALHTQHRMTVELSPLFYNGQHVANVFRCAECSQRGIRLTPLGEQMDQQEPLVSKLLERLTPQPNIPRETRMRVL